LQRINGYPVTELIDNSRDRRQEGLLGLQVHSGQGPFLNEFKDIRIRRFADDFGRAIVLVDGNDFGGWMFSGPQVKNAWRVKDGVLINTGPAKGHVGTTSANYRDYVLRFQYRSDKTRGGVLLRAVSKQGTGPPTCIRISGEGDDFNLVEGIGGYELKARQVKTAFRPMPEGFWNECEIRLNKKRLEIEVNGVLRAKAVDCTEKPGRIAFESAGGRAEYRNIVLIPILDHNVN
jgi:hypothetical protein